MKIICVHGAFTHAVEYLAGNQGWTVFEKREQIAGKKERRKMRTYQLWCEWMRQTVPKVKEKREVVEEKYKDVWNTYQTVLASWNERMDVRFLWMKKRKRAIQKMVDQHGLYSLIKGEKGWDIHLITDQMRSNRLFG